MRPLLRHDITLASKRLDDLSAAGRETPDLLTADRLLEHKELVQPEPEGMWRHLLYSLSGRRINLGDSKRARDRKELTARIAGPLDRRRSLRSGALAQGRRRQDHRDDPAGHGSRRCAR